LTQLFVVTKPAIENILNARLGYTCHWHSGLGVEAMVKLDFRDIVEYNLWALLPLLLIPLVFYFTRRYFNLTYRNTVWHSSFLFCGGLLVAASGILLRVFPIARLSTLTPHVDIFLIVLGFALLAVAPYRWTFAPELPTDRTVICVVTFAAIGTAASNDAEVISDRIWEDLISRSADGVPIDLKRARVPIRGVDEEAARKECLKLATSREYRSHIVISGDVRVDGQEILVRPRITFANQVLPSVRDPDILPSRHDGNDTITFKRRLSSEISDVTLFACALSYFRNNNLDACLALLSGTDSRELLLLSAVALLKKAKTNEPTRKHCAGDHVFGKHTRPPAMAADTRF
jgi:hypothetical protein